MYQYTTKNIQRFWSKVHISNNIDDCWDWQQGCDKYGYGKFVFNNIRIKSHRFAWMITNGQIPEGLYILHSCDNRKCCNPKHLFLGTHLDNIKDKVAKGRQLKWEDNPLHKLTIEQVKEIRRLYAGGDITQRILGIQFNVSEMTISRIVSFKAWKGDF